MELILISVKECLSIETLTREWVGLILVNVKDIILLGCNVKVRRDVLVSFVG